MWKVTKIGIPGLRFYRSWHELISKVKKSLRSVLKEKMTFRTPSTMCIRDSNLFLFCYIATCVCIFSLLLTDRNVRRVFVRLAIFVIEKIGSKNPYYISCNKMK